MAMAMASLVPNGDADPDFCTAVVTDRALELVTFSPILDDIIFPDGRASIPSLGGGGPQCAFGALLWCSNGERVGLAGGVGEDFPEYCELWLEKAGVDTGGLLRWPCPSVRVWHLSEPVDGSEQNMENDHVQAEIKRLAFHNQRWEILLPDLHLLPPRFQKARTYHVAVHPSGRTIPFLRSLRTGAAIVSVEVFHPADEVLPHSELQALVSTGHIFSPNEQEAASLVGSGTPLELIKRLSELGAEIVVLRRGPLGSIVHRSDTKETWEVPAFHTIFLQQTDEMKTVHKAGLDVKPLVDPTGCGNAFCGAFLLGWYKTRNLLIAALWGSTSASFMLEYEGLPPPLVSEWKTVAQRRLALLQPHVKRIEFL